MSRSRVQPVELDELFTNAGVVYAAMKGAHVREVVYGDPALRPAADIDILVRPDQRLAAGRLLAQAGYELHVDPDVISHEILFTRDWSTLISIGTSFVLVARRVSITDLLLDRRQRRQGFWGLDDADSVFLMLVHPAFNKYVCSPKMKLMRVIDLVLWLQQRPVEWVTVQNMLDSTGLNAAAWTTIKWFTMLLPSGSLSTPREKLEQMQPGSTRRRICFLVGQRSANTVV